MPLEIDFTVPAEASVCHIQNINMPRSMIRKDMERRGAPQPFPLRTMPSEGRTHYAAEAILFKDFTFFSREAYMGLTRSCTVTTLL